MPVLSSFVASKVSVTAVKITVLLAVAPPVDVPINKCSRSFAPVVGLLYNLCWLLELDVNLECTAYFLPISKLLKVKSVNTDEAVTLALKNLV